MEGQRERKLRKLKEEVGHILRQHINRNKHTLHPGDKARVQDIKLQLLRIELEGRYY